MIERFIKTGNAPGGDGTENVSSGPTRAYSGLAEALAPYYNGSLPDHLRIHASGATPDTVGNSNTPGFFEPFAFTTTPTNKLEIIGDNESGRYNPLAYRIEVTNKSGLGGAQAAHVELRNLQVQIKVTDGNVYFCHKPSSNFWNTSGGAGNWLVKNCIAKTEPTSTSGFVVGYRMYDGGSAGTVKLINSVTWGFAQRGGNGFETDDGAWVAANVAAYNCNAYLHYYGFLSVKCVNCLSAQSWSGSDFLDLTLGSDYNASADGTADDSGGGTHSRVNQTFAFVDAAGYDFHLQEEDTGALGHGLVDPLAGAYLDDLGSVLRPAAWSIGALEQAPPSQTDILPDPWLQIGTMPAALEGHAAARFDGAYWVAGGLGSKKLFKSLDGGATFEEVGVNSLPFTVQGHTLHAFLDKLWMFGGSTAEEGTTAKTWWTVDGLTWTPGPDLPTPLAFHASVEFEDEIWFISGHNGTWATLIVYAFNGTTFREVGDEAFPIALQLHAAAVFNGTIIVSGGFDLATTTDVAAVYRLNMDKVTWDAEADLPFVAEGHAMFALEGRLWIAGGWIDDGRSQKVYGTDDLEEWLEDGEDSLPLALSYAPAVATEDTVLFFGGYDFDTDADSAAVFSPFAAIAEPGRVPDEVELGASSNQSVALGASSSTSVVLPASYDTDVELEADGD